MMNKHKISTAVLIILILIGTAGAVIVNIDGSNFVPLSWFNTNKTVWDAVNTTVNFYTGNASNITSGTLSKAVMPANVSYNSSGSMVRVYNASQSANLINNILTKLILNTKSFNVENNWNITTSIFTASYSGYYEVDFSIFFSGTTVDNTIYEVRIYKNGTAVTVARNYATGTGSGVQVRGRDEIPLEAGSTIEIYIVSGSGNNGVFIDASDSRFTFLNIHYVRNL